jgi:hypothetical protein
MLAMQISSDSHAVFSCSNVEIGTRLVTSVCVEVGWGAVVELIADTEFMADIKADGGYSDGDRGPRDEAQDDLFPTGFALTTRQNVHNRTYFPRMLD